MSIVITSGGATSDNSIEFTTYNFKVTSVLENSNINVKEEKRTTNKNFIWKIPVLNILAQLIYSLFNNGVKPYILLISYIIDVLILKINLPDYLYLSYFFILSIVVKITNIKELHGAEHMIYNYYVKKQKISNEDIDEILKGKTSVFSCGTTVFILNLLFLFSFKLVINDFIIRFIIANIISYNAVMLSHKYYIVRKILSPIFFISNIIQEIMFVSKPKKIHLEIGISAIKKLEELEENL
jgi:uncharacterized protein YqhQ